MSERVYEPISLKRYPEYMDRLAECPQQVSDYSFANIWGWAEEYGLEWYWGDSCVWLRQTRPEVVNWAPVGAWDKADWSRCPTLPTVEKFTRVPERLALHWQEVLDGKVELVEARGHWDYVYEVGRLAELRGNKLHRKKNLVNQFRKIYDFQYLPITADCIEETLEMQDEWLAWQELEDSRALKAENRAIARVLKDWDTLPNLLGGTLRIDGRIVAYTVAEPITDDTLVIHFEKGHPAFKGVYQAINQSFLKHAGLGYSWVNREQDLDDEGLRKAKMSYYPDTFMKKYTVLVR
ncbi:MAG: DUF2156 domain-containing protein [Desulfovibrionaceae bacterium]|jgi:hypothetical protein|nr:DUF2156 domain-containing protein [Desulfovibrionaceae bacterium]